MKRFLIILAGLAGCTCVFAGETPVVTVTSPDGHNAIRLFEAPLRYDVLRDGVTLVGQSPIGLTVNGHPLAEDRRAKSIVDRSGTGSLAMPVYKKGSIDLTRREKFADFGDWGVGLVARNDGVAYRFETKMPGEITIDDECAELSVPDGKARCWPTFTGRFGPEESLEEPMCAEDVVTDPNEKVKSWLGKRYVYLPFVYTLGGKTVAVTESDVCDYPCWYLVRNKKESAVTFKSAFAHWPAKTHFKGGADEHARGRWQVIDAPSTYLVKTSGTRTLPWRVFILVDSPAKLCESDIVCALARPSKGDFSWVRPGKVAWDWWNAFDNLGDEEGCTTKNYERFIDFASKNGVEYVIFDEGWSERLNIWKFHPKVDVPHLIQYAAQRNVGIILWMAWAQLVGDEEHVAQHFAGLGARGFKVDFMDRADAACERSLWKFADACARRKLLVDYHGMHRPTGLSRTYPNVINYEGIHGLEQMKWYKGRYDFPAHDVRCFFVRLTAGPMDYTPGAMDNYPVGAYIPPDPDGGIQTMFRNPGSVGTRCRQMAMLILYEAPLQMLCDSPTKYERNVECFRFMASTPTVWNNTLGLEGDPESHIIAARQAKDGAWYVAGMTNRERREITIDTSFLGTGTWDVEIFRDAADAARHPTHYVHETISRRAGESLKVTLAPGGGFATKFTRRPSGI